MDEIITLSESKCYYIILQIIKTLSILIININNRVILYYILSNNFINKIIKSINTDFIKSDEDFLSYYVNFLKSISLKIDLTLLQFFFMPQTGSFPLLESALSLYNNQDKMIQSVIKNVFLIMLKLKHEQLINYICSLPSLTYFSFISYRLIDTLILLSNEKNYDKFKTFQEDIIDELIFIQDIFCLKIEKINHIMLNSLFNYCILPFILNQKYDKIKLNIKLYFIIAILTIIQDESFLNIFFTILFFPFTTKEINNLIINTPKLPDNYFYQWTEKNNNIQLISESLINYTKYNFNEKSYKYIFSSDDEKFSEIKKLKEKYKNNNYEEKLIQEEVINHILNNCNSEQKKNIIDYNYNISFGTGVSCGINKFEENPADNSFINVIEKLYVIYYDKNLGLKYKLIDNNIKEFLYSLISIKNINDNILFLICLLMRYIIIKNNDKISKLLLRQVKMINGNFLNENEINDIKKINNDPELIKKKLITEEFYEFEDDDDDDDEDDFEKLMEKRNKRLIITKDDNKKIKESKLINNDNENKNKIKNYDEKYFRIIEQNIDKIDDKFKKDNLYYYDINLIETFISILELTNNLKPIMFKCITEIILSLISKNYNSLSSQRINSKIKKIYDEYKQYIITSYNNNKTFHYSAYNKFQQQYKYFLSLINIDYDDIIKQGSIIINKNLENFNSNNLYDYENLIINNNIYTNNIEEELNDNIIKFFIIHDLYYIISNNDSYNNIKNILFMNNYPLLFKELNLNEQYFLCDLSTNIKYFSCKCKINKNKNISNFDSTLLLYENQVYIGNSSSNPNYTRIVEKYPLSKCTFELNKSDINCFYMNISDNDNKYAAIEITFSDEKLCNKVINIMEEEIENCRKKEKEKFKDFLRNLK